MTVDLHTGPLGESADYTDGYDSKRLFPMPRQEGREAVSLSILTTGTDKTFGQGMNFRG